MKTGVLDAKGKTVAQMESTQTIAAGATNVFDQTSAPVAESEALVAGKSEFIFG